MSRYLYVAVAIYFSSLCELHAAGVPEDCKKAQPAAMLAACAAVIADPGRSPEEKGDAHFFRGVAHLKVQDFTNAVAEFTRALELKPRLVEAYLNRGGAYGLLGLHEKTIEDMNSAIALRPGAAAYQNRGRALLAIGRIRDAEIDFKRALIFDQRYVEARVGLAAAHEASGDLDAALSTLQFALEISKDHEEAKSAMARIIRKREKAFENKD